MGFGAVIWASFSAWFLRICLGFCLGERGSLAFISSRCFYQQLLQLCHSLLQNSYFPFEPSTIRTSVVNILAHKAIIGEMGA